MDASRRWGLLRIVITTLFLTVVWVFFSGNLEPLSLAAGFAGSVIIAILSYDVFIEDHEAGRRSILPRFLPALWYPFRLAASMYASSCRVLVAVMTGRVEPRVVHFKSKLRSDLARVVLAHSITFTPGTITLDLDDDHFIVHWLFATTRHALRAGNEVKGDLEEAVRRIWS